jgi:hypothetical protein
MVISRLYDLPRNRPGGYYRLRKAGVHALKIVAKSGLSLNLRACGFGFWEVSRFFWGGGGEISPIFYLKNMISSCSKKIP